MTIEKPYIITYSNHLYFNNKKYAFRAKELFNIDNTPIHIPKTAQGYWIGKTLLSPLKAKELVKMNEVKVDVSNLQWYQQEQLNHVFNL